MIAAHPFDRAAFAALGIDLPDYRGPTLAERADSGLRAQWHKRELAEVELAGIAAGNALRRAELPATGAHSDAELRGLADRRADRLSELIDGIDRPMASGELLTWLNAHVERLQARPFRFEGDRPEPDQMRGFMARSRCALWWRRQLRRAAVIERETRGRAGAEVCATRRQPYVTNDTARRRAQRQADTAAMMAATELENDQGQVMTLAELSAASTSSKAIRRGELMTRIRGCEALAELHGMRGVFLTLTAPSRFHSVHRHGERNARHDGSTPKDAHAWLCATWAKARAALARRGIAPFGFRVAEPHHDGTPHWHGLLWVKAGKLWRLVRVLKRWWLADEGTEPGARRHRVKAMLMRPGGASGYIAKYIAKNIDDAGAIAAEGHRDEGAALDADRLPEPAQLDAFGGTAQRVEAWASAWGIRQFQAIGQPPVTVWRELRRITDQAQGGATPRLHHAFEAVNRKGERRADWALYVIAQGGLGRGRDYLIRIARELRQVFGRYETTDQARPIGVTDASGPGDLHLSDRREWKPRGQWAQGVARPKVALPWTRVNNCTRRGAADLMRSGIVGIIRASGDGSNLLKANPPCPMSPKSPRSSRALPSC